jgi:hypothetical protein
VGETQTTETTEEITMPCNWKKKPKTMKNRVAAYAQKHYEKDAKKIRDYRI